jgi:hypothetical protein
MIALLLLHAVHARADYQDHDVTLRQRTKINVDAIWNCYGANFGLPGISLGDTGLTWYGQLPESWVVAGGSEKNRRGRFVLNLERRRVQFFEGPEDRKVGRDTYPTREYPFYDLPHGAVTGSILYGGDSITDGITAGLDQRVHTYASEYLSQLHQSQFAPTESVADLAKEWEEAKADGERRVPRAPSRLRVWSSLEACRGTGLSYLSWYGDKPTLKSLDSYIDAKVRMLYALPNLPFEQPQATARTRPDKPECGSTTCDTAHSTEAPAGRTPVNAL